MLLRVVLCEPSSLNLCLHMYTYVQDSNVVQSKVYLFITARWADRTSTRLSLE